MLAQSEGIAEVARFEREGEDILERVRVQTRQLVAVDTR